MLFFRLAEAANQAGDQALSEVQDLDPRHLVEELRGGENCAQRLDCLCAEGFAIDLGTVRLIPLQSPLEQEIEHQARALRSPPRPEALAVSERRVQESVSQLEI